MYSGEDIAKNKGVIVVGSNYRTNGTYCLEDVEHILTAIESSVSQTHRNCRRQSRTLASSISARRSNGHTITSRVSAALPIRSPSSASPLAAGA